MLMFLRVLLLFIASAGFMAAQEWRPVRGGITGGISDLALVEHSPEKSSFLVVHDNKAPSEPRIGLITVSGPKPVVYQPVEWKWEKEVIDLESIAAFPGRPGEFVALISRGTAFHLKLAPDHLHLETLGHFNLPDPPPNQNFEGLSLQMVDGRFLIAWADRGDGPRPARIYFGEFQPQPYAVKHVRSITMQVPWPTQYVRHVSEMKVDETGVLFIAAASDPGDDGPFASAIYLGGIFRPSPKGGFDFRPHPRLLRLRTIPDHKIEALELVPGLGGIILGTDDENFGGWVMFNW